MVLKSHLFSFHGIEINSQNWLTEDSHSHIIYVNENQFQVEERDYATSDGTTWRNKSDF